MNDPLWNVGIFVFLVALFYAFAEVELSVAVGGALLLIGAAEIFTSLIALLVHAATWVFFEMQKKDDRE